MYIPMWHMWSSNFFFWQMKCQWMKIWSNKVWDTRKVATNWFLMLEGHTCHRFVAWIWANESHPDRFIQLRTSVCKAPQTAKEGNQNVPRCSTAATHFSTLKHSSDVNVSMCHTSRDSSESRFWFSSGVHFTMLNHILIHFERFHDIAENIRKREGAIATCSDTLTTASFPQSYSINQRQSRSNLALVKLDCWQCHRQIYHLCLVFQGRETDSKGRNVCAEAVRQHAGNRRWGSVWANDRLLDVWAGDLDFRVCRDFQRFTKESFQGFDGFCLLLCTVCMCAWIDCSLKIQFWNFHEISICFVLGEGPWFKTHIDTLISLNSRDISHIHHLSLIFSSLLDINVCSPPWLTTQGLLAFLKKSVPGLESLSKIFISIISVVLLVWGVGICLASVCRHLVACDHLASLLESRFERLERTDNECWLMLYLHASSVHNVNP